MVQYKNNYFCYCCCSQNWHHNLLILVVIQKQSIKGNVKMIIVNMSWGRKGLRGMKLDQLVLVSWSGLSHGLGHSWTDLDTNCCPSVFHVIIACMVKVFEKSFRSGYWPHFLLTAILLGYFNSLRFSFFIRKQR